MLLAHTNRVNLGLGNGSGFFVQALRQLDRISHKYVKDVGILREPTLKPNN